MSAVENEEVIFDPTLELMFNGSNLVSIVEIDWLKELIGKTDCALKLKGYSSLTNQCLYRPYPEIF